MAPMPKVMTQADLFPPSPPIEVTRALEALTGDRDRDSRCAVLSRALSDPERAALRKFVTALDPYIAKGTRTLKGDAILSMLMGLGGQTLSREEAAELTVHYVTVCDDLPIWAVRRACHRFATGDVKPDEVGAKEINLAFRPSTAQLYRVAANHATPILQMRYKMGEALRGVVMLAKPTLTPEQREANALKIRESLERFKIDSSQRELMERDRETLALQATARTMVAANEKMILDEYRAKGLEPPERVGDRPLVSLPMMLRLGWSIQEDGRGQKVLVAPGRAPRAPPKRPPEDMNDSIPF